MSLSRRTLAKVSGAALFPLVAPTISRAADTRTLRFVPQANLSTLDPVFATAAVTITHGYCVFDMLYGVDGKQRPHPQMAEGATMSDDGRAWPIRLRDGLRFHTVSRCAPQTAPPACNDGASATPSARRSAPPWTRSRQPTTARSASS